MFGNENIGGCKRYGANHCSTPRNKKHNGIDLASTYGTSIYSMYDGVVTYTDYQPSGAGYYTNIQCIVNGETITIGYFHLQANILTNGANVTQGQVIGYQGDSGNLDNAINSGSAISHLHIKVKNANGTPIDPRNYLGTEIDDNGNTIQQPCN